MRYMLFIKHGQDQEQVQAPASLYEAMDEFVGECMASGVMLDGAGLQPMAKATRLRLAKGKVTVTDGPFAETKEVIGGYALCEFATRDEALAFATKFMDLHRIHWPEFEGELELRPIEESVTPSLETEAARAAQPT